MGEKSVQKRKFILETARKVFAEKGFTTVTMKDIVEACEISRGGLYLYFDSTEQIFTEVLKLESEETDQVFSENITDDATAADILVVFLQQQKKAILGKEGSLTQAVYEYYFANQPANRKENVLKKKFDSSARIIEKLIEIGVEDGEFVCEDCRETARNIMYLIEGLKISAQTMGLSDEAVDRQILLILQSLGVEMETEE